MKLTMSKLKEMVLKEISGTKGSTVDKAKIAHSFGNFDEILFKESVSK